MTASRVAIGRGQTNFSGEVMPALRTSSPKGWQPSAQGNALGQRGKYSPSLKGWEKLAALQAAAWLVSISQGIARCRSLALG